MREAFSVFDTSGDGKIDAGELQAILQAVIPHREVTLEEVNYLIASVDESADGSIELPEFLKLVSDQM